MAYTKGYHPRLKTSAGPSLALGAWGLDEWIEVTFLGMPACGWDALVTELQEVMIEGIEVLRIVVREGPKPKVPRAYEWLLRLARPVDPAAIEAARKRWATDGLQCERKGRLKDLAPAIQEVTIPTQDQTPGCIPDAPGLLRLVLNAEAIPRGEEVAADLGFSRDEVLSVIRVGGLVSAAK